MTILVSRSFQTIVTFRTFSIPWSIFVITKCRVLQSINNLMHIDPSLVFRLHFVDEPEL